eukprot:TRINITY_DN6477_c0_g2_i3.p3 TRINITY_DN6477_c0_g2~~TRINITY_DN6477_c0_g2_i3.p3  ORF type:complete len:132 (-),score=16.84 TRINITY_DN6477_c0_g2_i3:20-415(-)
MKDFLLKSLSREASNAKTIDNILEGGKRQALTDRLRISATSNRIIIRKRQHILKDLRRTCSLVNYNRTAPFNSPNAVTAKEKSMIYLRDHGTQCVGEYINIETWYASRLSLIHICRCRRIERCRSRWSPYH